MNLIYDKRIKRGLCPKCRGVAHWNDNGDLKCSEKDCGFIYVMFAVDKSVIYFQLELFDEL